MCMTDARGRTPASKQHFTLFHVASDPEQLIKGTVRDNALLVQSIRTPYSVYYGSIGHLARSLPGASASTTTASGEQ
jgi:hypothetical protein